LGELLNAYAQDHSWWLYSLGVCFLAGRWIGAATSAAMKCFLVLWLIGALVNMWVGVSRAGYSIQDEAPVALIVFAVPAIVAILIWWKSA
jgi:hypothetical protein